MQLLQQVKRIDSKIEDVTKYVFPGNIELVYLDSQTGKDIICIPSQTGCKLGCEFCHLTYRNDLKVAELDPLIIGSYIEHVIKDRQLLQTKNSTLLLSFMGSGDPLLSPNYVHQVIHSVNYFLSHNEELKNKYTQFRASIATIFPSRKIASEFITELDQTIGYSGLSQPIKIHLSLHTTKQNLRNKLMPKALNIAESIALLAQYSRQVFEEAYLRDKDVDFDNILEFNFTLCKDNCTEEEAERLAFLSKTLNIPIRLLKFSERPDNKVPSASALQKEKFINILNTQGVKYQEYTPPGHDILAACGEFEYNL